MQEIFATIHGEFVDLDGERRAYVAHPSGTRHRPGILVFQEAFGVNEYIQSEVRRLAAAGYTAVAPDLYRGRTFDYADDPAPRQAFMKTLTDESLLADVRAAMAYLDRDPLVKHEAYGTVGFCMGGRLSFLVAAEFGAKIGAAVSFYGGGIAPVEPGPRTPLVDRIPDIHAHLLMVYGADDQFILSSEHARLVDALSTAKKRYTLDVYPGAGHGFASVDRPSYRGDQAELAWKAALRLFFDALDHSRQL